MTLAPKQLSIADGIHAEMSEKEYRSLPFANFSTLKIMHQKTPKHVRWALDNPAETTDAMRIGSAFHCLSMRPNDFAQEFMRGGKCSVIKSDGTGCENDGKLILRDQWVCGVHRKGATPPELPVIMADEYTAIEGMRDALVSHRKCRELLTGLSEASIETPLLWTDPVTGVRCKAKLDLFGRQENTPIIVDIKSCTDASADEFGWQIANMGYAMQAAMYLDGLSIVLGGEQCTNFYFLAVEKEPPYACAPWHLYPEDIDMGREQYRLALQKWKYCHENNAWPGHAGGMIHLPKSYFQKEMTKL